MVHPQAIVPLKAIDHPPGEPNPTPGPAPVQQPVSQPIPSPDHVPPACANADPKLSPSTTPDPSRLPSPTNSISTPKFETHSNTIPTSTNNIKKFKASSLSVNKKFLSQSTSVDSKSSKNSFNASPRLTSLTPSSNSSPLATGPRLLTGKIGANSSILAASGSSTSGWARTPLAVPPMSLAAKSPELGHLALPAGKSTGPNSLPRDETPRTGLNGFLQNSSQQQPSNPQSRPSSNNASLSPWAKLGNPQPNGTPILANDFPTAQEVANHTKLKAQSVAAAVAARDKASQDRAAASAAYNQQLLQTLDGFRGTHLDPNTSHWDEMEDEDDMFGEVVEFGDGTQYKVAEISAASNDPHQSPSTEKEPTSTSSQSIKKEDRFAEDYDRTSQPIEGGDSLPPFFRGRAELKSLFNERLGKFEPYSAKTMDKSKDNSTPVQVLQRHPSENQNLTSQVNRTQNSTSADVLTPSQQESHTTIHAPSSRQQTDLCHDKSLRPPSLDRATCAPASQPHPSSLEPSSGSGTVSTSSTNASKTLVPDSSLKPFYPTVADLDEFHRTEMTSAAERARKRRQEEEAAREAEKQRAKQKAIDMEVKLKAEAAAAAAALAVKSPPKTLSVLPSDSAKRNYSKEEDTRFGSRIAPTDRKDADSWRARPIAKPTHPSSHSASATIPEAPPTTSAHRPILSRPPPSSGDAIQQFSKQSESSGFKVERPSNFFVASSRAPSTLPPQDEAFKNRKDSASPQPNWKSQINSALSSQLSSHSPENAGYSEKARRPAEDLYTNWRPKDSATDSVRRRPDPGQRPSYMFQNTDKIIQASPILTPRDAEIPRANPPSSLPTLAPLSALETASQSSWGPSTSFTQATFSQGLTSTFSSNSRPSLQDKKAYPRLPEMSLLDTVMSRIKGVLDADKEAREQAKLVATTVAPCSETAPVRLIQKLTLSSSSSSAIKSLFTSTPTLVPRPDTLANPSIPKPQKLTDVQGSGTNPSVVDQGLSTLDKPASPPSRLAPIITVSSSSISAVATTSLEPTIQKSVLKPPACGLPSALSNPAEKKSTSIRKAARFDLSPRERYVPLEGKLNAIPDSSSSSRPVLKIEPSFINRDPTPLWDVTKETPPLPEPVWKKYTVKLGRPVKPKRKPPPHTLKAFWNILTPARVNVLTWDPPLANLSPRTLSRDDLLFRKKLIRGVVVSNVVLPKKTIERQIGMADKGLGSSERAPYRLDHDHPREGGPLFMRGRGRGSGPMQSTSRGKGRGRADGTMSWRRPIEEAVAVSTVEPVVGAAQAPSPKNPPLLESLEVAPSTSALTRKNKSKLPEGSKVAFNRPPNLMSTTSLLTPGMFMVNSEISGEVPQSHSLGSSELELKRTGSCSTPDDSMATPLTPRNRASPTPMPLTSPASNIHSSSKGSPSPWTKSPLAFSVLDSHTKNVWSQPDGRITTKPTPTGKIENSLEGIPDDFVAALPRTLNDFNAEDESVPETVKEDSRAFSGRRNPSYISPPGPKRISPTTADRPLAQTGTSGTNSTVQIQPSPNGLEESSMSNGHGQPTFNNPSSGSGAQDSSGSFPCPAGFQVPPGYQLVPIGTVPPNPQPVPYSGLSGIYLGQATGPWSPSPTSQQPSGFARSPQSYSLNANYPPPLHPIGFSSPHSANQPQNNGGFNKTLGPIAPRGARPTSSGMPSPHLGRQAENNFVPAVGRNNYLKPAQTSAMPGYAQAPPPPPAPVNNSIDPYGNSFAQFQSRPPPPPPPHPSAFSTIHPGLSPQNPFSPSLTSSSSVNMFSGSSNHPASGVVQSYLPNPLHPPSFVPQPPPPPHFQGPGAPQQQPQQPLQHTPGNVNGAGFFNNQQQQHHHHHQQNNSIGRPAQAFNHHNNPHRRQTIPSQPY